MIHLVNISINKQEVGWFLELCFDNVDEPSQTINYQIVAEKFSEVMELIRQVPSEGDIEEIEAMLSVHADWEDNLDGDVKISGSDSD